MKQQIEIQNQSTGEILQIDLAILKTIIQPLPGQKIILCRPATFERLVEAQLDTNQPKQ